MKIHLQIFLAILLILLYNVPDDVPVVLSSDTGVDQGMGEIVVLSAHYYNYPRSNIREFAIYANDMGDE